MGRLRGAAWLGQPLDLSIQVQHEVGESLSSLCFDAEVFHADTRLDPGRIRVNVEATALAQMAQIRLQTMIPVDEPVVTVYLRENCLSKTTRRYVLLADIPSDAPAAPALVAPVAIPAPVAQGASELPASHPVKDKPASQNKAVAPQMDRKTPVKARPVVERPMKEMPAGKQEREAKAKPEKPLQIPVVKKPQLKLDPLLSLSERVVQLEEATLASHAGQSDQEDQRLKKMEDSVQALLTLAAKNERSMAELRERLQQAESEKYDNLLVYGLLFLLLVTLGLLAFLWRRQQERSISSDVWRGPTETPRMAVQSVVVPRGSGRSIFTTDSMVAATVVATASAPSDADPITQPPEVESLPERQGAVSSDVDLDDLIGSVPDAPASEGDVSSLQDGGFPELSGVKAVGDAPEKTATSGQQGAVEPVPAFPAVDPVHIDVSHLSLAPVQTREPVGPDAPLLDFDFSNLTNSDQSDGGKKKPE